MDYLYYITLALSLIIAGLSLHKKNNKLFFLLLLPMLYIVLFRFGQGIDYFSYEVIYNVQDVSSFGSMLDHQKRFEPGLRVLIYIFKKIGLSPHVFIVAMSLVIMVFMALWIYENSDNAPVSLALYYGMFFLVWNLSALRQGVVLSIGLYFLFSKKQKLSFAHQIILIFALSLFHYSALFLLVLLLLKKIDISNKYLVFFIALSIISTLLPLNLLIEKLSFLPLMTRVSGQMTRSPGFFDFSSVVRMFFSIYLLFLLYHYEWKKDDRYYIQAALFGIGLYFFMKPMEVWAGRLGIYTFIYFVLIFVMHVNQIESKNYSVVISVGILSFSCLYFQKDIRSMQYLTGNLKSDRFPKFVSIFNVSENDYWDFSNEYSFYTYYSLKEERELDEFFDEYSIKYEPYDENVSQMVVYSPLTTRYGIINNNGFWITDQNYGKKPILRNRVVQRFKDGSLNSFEYEDRFSLGLSSQEIEKEVYDSVMAEQKFLEFIPETVEADLKSMPDELINLFPNPDEIERISVTKFDVPFSYSIVQVKYFDYIVFAYLDGENDLLINDLFLDLNRFDRNGMLRTKGMNHTRIYNSKGECIWYESN